MLCCRQNNYFQSNNFIRSSIKTSTSSVGMVKMAPKKNPGMETDMSREHIVGSSTSLERTTSATTYSSYANSLRSDSVGEESDFLAGGKSTHLTLGLNKNWNHGRSSDISTNRKCCRRLVCSAIFFWCRDSDPFYHDGHHFRCSCSCDCK